jgi:hypothetical protein
LERLVNRFRHRAEPAQFFTRSKLNKKVKRA